MSCLVGGGIIPITGGVPLNNIVIHTTEPKWVPVEKGLPDKDGKYLVTTRGNYNDIIDIANYTKGIWHKANEIIAWMPLPEPYKEIEK